MSILTYEKWKEWIDIVPEPGHACESVKQIPSRSVDSPEETSQHLRARRVKLEGKVLALVDPEGNCSKGDLWALRRKIALSHFLSGTDLEPYLCILNAIVGALSTTSDLVRLTHEEILWRDAVSEAKHWVVHSPYVSQENNPIISYPRQAALATAAKWLTAKGYSLKARDGRIDIADLELRRMAQQLDDDIRRLGGHRLARHLIDPGLGGHHARTARQYLGKLPWLPDPNEQRQPLVPVGYLLNLAVKHLNEPFIALGRGDGSKLLNDILETAQMIASIYDAQPYAKIDEVVWPRHEFIEKLIEYVRFDRLFIVPDCRPSDVPGIVTALFGWIDGKRIGWTAVEAARFAEGCLCLVDDNMGPNLLNESRIWQTVTDLRHETFTKLLGVFSHEQSEVNRGFLLPDNPPAKSDFMFKPLIKIGKQDYCLMHRSWCGPAFYEALAADLRHARIHDADKMIGIALEQYVRQAMEASGVSLISGKYETRDFLGDCDAAVETSDTILLFEVKKKPLRRQSRAGDELKILVDMAKGLIYGIYQLTKQAVLLRERGELTMTKDGKTFRLESKGRSVERIYVSLDAYGGLQDRVFTEKFLEFIYSTALGALDEYRPELETINNYSSKMRECQRRLSRADCSQFHGPFFDCTFLSLPYFLYLLDDVSCNESLRNAVRLNRNVTFGTRDPYAEYTYAKTIKSHEQTKDQI